MEKQVKIQMTLIVVLVVFILAMSIGFANTAYTKLMSINGSASVVASSWNIAFDTTSYAESSGSVAATNHELTGTTMLYTVTLAEPGDFYEFTVNVKNTGTFDANLKSIVMSGLTATQAEYVNYSITYAGGTTYTATNSSITGVVLAKNTGSDTVKVRVEYVAPEDASKLPSSDQTISLTASLNYQQVQ